MHAVALDGLAFEVGSENGTKMSRVAAQWDWNRRLLQGADWHVGGYWDLALGYWRNDNSRGIDENLVEVGLTPVLRLQHDGLEGPYVEVGAGLHLQSETTIGDKRMGTAFQFGSHVGIGFRFGAKGALDLSYRYQHLSNAGLKQPNDGINFNQIRLQYHF